MKKDEFLEVCREIKEKCKGKCSFSEEDGILQIYIKGQDSRIFDRYVMVSMDNYNGADYAAVMYRGKPTKENGHDPTYACFIPQDTKFDLMQAAKLALACAFDIAWD